MSKEKTKKEDISPEEETAQEPIAEETVQEDKTAEELARTKDSLLRVMAEYDNFRKRSQKEKEQAYGDSKASAISEFLPVYDNFLRAMDASADDAEAFKKGMDMIFTQFGDTLTKLGVEPFGEKGDAFDPNIHNAVMHGEDEELPENSVSDVFSKGYKMGDRIIRPAVVKVVN